MSEDDSTARRTQWLDDAERMLARKREPTKPEAMVLSGLFAAAGIVRLAEQAELLAPLAPLADDLRAIATDLVDEHREWQAWSSATRGKSMLKHFDMHPLRTARAHFVAHYLRLVASGMTPRAASTATRRAFKDVHSRTADTWIKLARSADESANG
jgi:hypothetical protein